MDERTPSLWFAPIIQDGHQPNLSACFLDVFFLARFCVSFHYMTFLRGCVSAYLSAGVQVCPAAPPRCRVVSSLPLPPPSPSPRRAAAAAFSLRLSCRPACHRNFICPLFRELLVKQLLLMESHSIRPNEGTDDRKGGRMRGNVTTQRRRYKITTIRKTRFP